MRILFLVLVLLAPVKSERATFKIRQDGRQIGDEQFSVAPVATGYLAEGRTRISIGEQKFDLRSRLEMDRNLRPLRYQFESAGSTIRLKIEQPVSELEVESGGQRTKHDVRFPENGMILDDNFFHHYLLLLYRTGEQGGMIPVFVPQQMTIGSVIVKNVGGRVFELDSSNLKLSAATDADGRLVRLTVPEAKVVVER